MAVIRSLAFRAKKICSFSLLSTELENIKSIIELNGCPLSVVERIISNILHPKLPVLTASPKPVFMRLPWLGPFSSAVARRVELATRAVVPWCKPFFVFTSHVSFTTCRKDALPAENLSHPIHLFNCECSRSNVGRTTQRLGERIQQHIPRDLVTAVTGGVGERRKPGRPRNDGASRVQSLALEDEPVSSRTRSKASI